jgi:hypothetical protein
MRKFAMTLILGLGMATASFAGTSTNAEEDSPKAPKGCFEYDAGCGARLLCGPGVSENTTSFIKTLLIIEAIDDCHG